LDHAARVFGPVTQLELAPRPRAGAAAGGSIAIALEVSDPDVVQELRRFDEGADRDRYALTALRVGVLALRAAGGQIDVASMREAGASLLADVRALLSAGASEMTERVAGHLAIDRKEILREFSLDQKGSALSRLVAEFTLDDERSALSRLSKILAATGEQIGKNLTLDDEASALARLRRELLATVGQLARDNVDFQGQVREALARLDSRRTEQDRTPIHGIAFEERLGALLAEEAARSGDLYEATGDSTGAIKHCKKGDHVIELGADSAAAHARIVWEAKEKQDYSLRSALQEIDEARRNRQAQVGVFVFSRKAAPDAIETLHRQGNDVVVVWDADDPASDLVVRAAYSLARALAVRERRTDKESEAAIAQIERSARNVEKQIGFLDDVRKWAETVKGHGEKIVDRSVRMAEELRRDVEQLDAQLASMRRSTA
jgi:hypothetical protein